MLWARYPFPSVSGRTKLLAQRLGFLENTDSIVHLLIFDTSSPEEQEERRGYLSEKFPFVKSVRFLPLPSLAVVAWNMLRYSLLSDRKTLQEAMFFSRRYAGFIREEIRRLPPETIYCDTFRTAQYLEGFTQSADYAELSQKPHIVFDWDDIFSQKYQNYLARTDDDTPLLGYLSKYVPPALQTFANHVLRRTLLRIEIRRSLRRESVLPRHADRTILVSPLEVETLRLRSKTTTISALLPAVRLPSLPNNVVERPQSLVFMGLLNFVPNEEGLLHFLEHIFPVIRKQFPRVTLTVLGANPTVRLLKAAENFGESVVLTGFVEDPLAILRSSEVFIAPVYYGTGIKTKILDAMACGVPVVTTPQGAEGLAVTSGNELVIAGNDNEFAEACARLIFSPTEREHIRAKALDYVRAVHESDVVRKEFLRICRVDEA